MISFPAFPGGLLGAGDAKRYLLRMSGSSLPVIFLKFPKDTNQVDLFLAVQYGAGGVPAFYQCT